MDFVKCKSVYSEIEIIIYRSTRISQKRKMSTRSEYNHTHQTQRDITLSKLFCFVMVQLLGTHELSLCTKFQISIFDDGTTACSQKNNKDIYQNTQKGHNSVFKLCIQIILKAGVR